MKISPIIPALTLLILAGCDGDSNVTALDLAVTDETEASEIVQLSFAGATFVAVDRLDVDRASGDGTVSFTDDTVTWSRSGLVEVGSYIDSGEPVLVASFPDRDIAFEENGFNLIWDSLGYSRTVGTQFDSQESMIAYLDGTTFNTAGQVGSGELPQCVLSVDADGVISDSCTVDSVPGNSSLSFVGDEVSWVVGGGVSVGTYTFVDSKSFKANFPDSEVTVVVLDRDELVIDSVVYHKDLSNQFDSQEALVAFLDGGSYRSTDTRSLGESSPGITAVGYWFVDFTGNTFTWAYEDVSEAGTISYLDGNSFTAIFSDREFTIEVEGDDILWDGVRYSKVTGE